MGVRLEQTEIDEFLERGHTLIITTVGKDGYPHSTPIWYACLGGQIYIRGRAKSQKARNIATNPKVAALVETGDYWRELKAVLIRGRAELVENPDEIERFTKALKDKYEGFREASSAMPERTQQHYATTSVHYKIVPEKRPATWDNTKIRLKK